MPAGPVPHRRKLTIICVAFTATIILLHLTEQRYRHAEEDARDWLATNGAARLSPQNPRLLFLGVDDASKNLDTLFTEDGDLEKSRALRLMKEGFPWNREVYAHIIDRLLKAGATMVIFDILFPNPRDGDEPFRTALELHGNRVVLGANLKDIAEDADSGQSTVNLKPAYILPSPTLMPSEKWIDPLIGFVNVKADDDGLVRRFIYRTTLLEFFGKPPRTNEPEILSLSAQALAKAGLGKLVPGTHQPVRFRFSEDIHPRSLHEIFVEKQWAAPPYLSGELFRDRIVLIGAAGNEAEDRLQTTHGAKLAPIIHLSAINAALNRDFVHEAGPATNLALILGGGALAWVLGAWARRPLLRLGLILGAILVFYLAAQFLYNHFGVLPIMLSPVLALATSGITWAAWEQVIDRVERQRTRRTLERYVGHDVAHEVLDNPASYLQSLGGMRKEVAVFFSDIRGFTAMTEISDPQALVAQLNEYFAEMVGIVFANHGTIDKFIGDAVMAHWGSIVSEGPEADAANAVTTALQMRKVLVRLNHGWKQREMIELQVGMGINQGNAIAGNIGASGASGAQEKMEFTVIGDAVNLASRLEGVTKQYHIDLCLGERVAELVRDAFIIRSVDLIVVKGKTRPEEVFTALGKRGPATKEPPWLARHEEATRLYRAGDFAGAEKLWREVLEQAPGDGIAEVFLERCAVLQKNPPTVSWAGVYEMTTK